MQCNVMYIHTCRIMSPYIVTYVQCNCILGQQDNLSLHSRDVSLCRSKLLTLAFVAGAIIPQPAVATTGCDKHQSGANSHAKPPHQLRYELFARSQASGMAPDVQGGAGNKNHETAQTRPTHTRTRVYVSVINLFYMYACTCTQISKYVEYTVIYIYIFVQSIYIHVYG